MSKEYNPLLRDWDKQIELAEGDDVQAAIGILRCSQESHKAWLDYTEAVKAGIVTNDGPRRGHKGRSLNEQIAFDRRCIDEYEKIIGVIERLRDTLHQYAKPQRWLRAHQPNGELGLTRCVFTSAGHGFELAQEVLKKAEEQP